ncbi:hypothetical protein [uncultured Gilvimarinus sp.]|uniref:hypothetical protein n=1 Tax=uncultured Gilvimarinus sp. TaxID=1689143 RepID=UPI0030DC736E
MENWVGMVDILSGLSTVAIAFLTVFLWRENRLLRKSGSEPRIFAYFEPHPDGTGGLNIAIANIGTGPARDVTFSFEGGAQDFDKYHLILKPSINRPPISLIPQGEKVSFLFAVGFNLFRPIGAEKSETPNPLKPFTVKVEWKSLSGKQVHSELCHFDVRQFSGLPGFSNKPYLLKIEEAIVGVGKEIGALKPMVGSLASLIETSCIEHDCVQKTKGNDESLG